MTVKELKEALAGIEEELNVVIYTFHDEYEIITSVDIRDEYISEDAKDMKVVVLEIE